MTDEEKGAAVVYALRGVKAFTAGSSTWVIDAEATWYLCAPGFNVVRSGLTNSIIRLLDPCPVPDWYTDLPSHD